MNSCPSATRTHFETKFNIHFSIGPPALNFFQKEDNTEKLPVMVFVHGGSYQTGSGAILDGSMLAGLDTIVVTFNYRLGALGKYLLYNYTLIWDLHKTCDFAFVWFNAHNSRCVRSSYGIYRWYINKYYRPTIYEILSNRIYLNCTLIWHNKRHLPYICRSDLISLYPMYQM